jgi:acetyl-CoA carboxylase carboxyl transferase subunit alpha
MYLEYEKKLLELKEKIENLQGLLRMGRKDVERELRKLQREFREKAKRIYRDLSPWDRVQIARHPKRPHTSDYIKFIFRGFIEIHGDRRFGDDKAILAGLAYFRGKPVAVVGHEKGRGTQEKIERNFGMPHPEGYRKAVRVMKLAERFKMPLIAFIDTPGAYPGVGAEERGQSEAIAESMFTMGRLKVPTIAVVVGEGGSGGALAIGVADRIAILENAYYSVISPEGCAAILWKDQDRVKEAAKALKLTAEDLRRLGVVDCVIPEPFGAAHWDHRRTALRVGYVIRKFLKELCSKDPETLVKERLDRFRRMGVYVEG